MVNSLVRGMIALLLVRVWAKTMIGCSIVNSTVLYKCGMLYTQLTFKLIFSLHSSFSGAIIL